MPPGYLKDGICSQMYIIDLLLVIEMSKHHVKRVQFTVLQEVEATVIALPSLCSGSTIDRERVPDHEACAGTA